MEGFSREAEQDNLLPLLPHLHSVPSSLDHVPCTGDGSVDFSGAPASREHSGRWRACCSILGGEFCGALAYYAVGTNLVSYLTKVQHQINVEAASRIISWQGTCYLAFPLGAFLADSYWGRHRTIIVSLTIFTLGMALLTLSAEAPESISSVVISPQDALCSLGLYMAALGLGGIWPCVPTFGADQFDDTDVAEKAQKELYYNWYYFAVNGGFFFASTVMVWIQDNCGWALGFGIPTFVLAIGIAGFLSSTKVYRYQKPGGSALTRTCQVAVAATRKRHLDVPVDSLLLYETPQKESAIAGSRKLMHTAGLTFLDRAATVTSCDKISGDLLNPWRLCNVTQVEELKILVRMMPVLATAIIFNTAEALFPLFVRGTRNGHGKPHRRFLGASRLPDDIQLPLHPHASASIQQVPHADGKQDHRHEARALGAASHRRRHGFRHAFIGASRLRRNGAPQRRQEQRAIASGCGCADEYPLAGTAVLLRRRGQGVHRGRLDRICV